MGEKQGKGEGGSNPITVVLKVDMHCDGCAKKVKRLVGGFEGVESVSTDNEYSKLIVVGKVEPGKLRESVELKIHKKVVLISPLEVPKKEEKKAEEKPKEEKKAEEKPKEEKKAQEKPKEEKKPEEKPKEAVVSTVVMKIRLHCDGCIQRIRRSIYKIKGVEEVTIDAQKELVIVKGMMDTSTLPSYVQQRFKRHVEVIPPALKKDDGGDKKDKGGGDKKEKADEVKKEKIADDGAVKTREIIVEKELKFEANKMEYHGGGGPSTHYYDIGSSTPHYASSSDAPMQQYYGAPIPAQPYYIDGGAQYYSSSSGAPMQQYYNGGAPMPVQYYGAPPPMQQYHDNGDASRGYMPYGYDVGHAPQLFSDENPNGCSVM